MNLTQRLAPRASAAVAAIATYVLLLVHTELEPWAVLLVGSITYLVSLVVVSQTAAMGRADVMPGGGRRTARARG